MIEGGNPRHICIDLTHFTSQSKIFDTADFLQSACQVLLMVKFDTKFLTKEAIETSANCGGGTTRLSWPTINCIYLVNMSIASKV